MVTGTLNKLEVGEAVVVGTIYTNTLLPNEVSGIVPEIPFKEPQDIIGAAGGVVQPVAVTLLDCKHWDSPLAWAVA